MPSTSQRPEVDVEIGQNIAAPRFFVRGTRGVERSSGWLAGLLLFFFLGMVLPVSLMILFLFSLLCIATCLRAYALHEYTQQLQLVQGRVIGRGDVPAARRPASATFTLFGQPIDLVNLQLSLVDRDFSDADYEMLLSLDNPANTRPVQAASDAQLAALPTHVHRAKTMKAMGTSKGSEEDEPVCSVCLDTFQAGAHIASLPCSHHFHSDCIQPWLRQQGLHATCPICKSPVFSS